MKFLPTVSAIGLACTCLVAGHNSPTWADDLGLEGVVRPHRVLHLGAATDGLLETVNFDRGARIEADEVVATLDARVTRAQADLSRARAERDSALQMVESRLKDARRRLAAQQALLVDGVTSSEAVDTIRTEVHLEELALAQQREEQLIAQLELKRTEATLAQATITSPIRGIVTERHLSPGEFYSRTAQGAVLTVAEIDPLVVEVSVPIERFEDIQVGDSARIRLDATGDPMRQAKVAVKDHAIDTASRTFQVQFHLANPDYELPSGLRCRVTFNE